MSVELLAKDVGTWRARVEVIVGPVPNVSTGTMTNRMTCGGQWLVSDYVGDSGEFQGHGMWTFDKTKGKFVGVWADNMMTFLAPGEGTWDEGTRTMTYLYEATIGEKHMKWRQTTRHVDDDTTEFASYVPDTAASPMMKASYTRAK